MKYRIEDRTVPSTYPIALDQVKSWIRLPSAYTFDDNLIEDILIPNVTDQVELYLGRRLISRELSMWIDRDYHLADSWWDGTVIASRASMFGPRILNLRWMPIQSIDKVYWYSEDGTQNEFDEDNYYLDITDENANGRIILHDGSVWPVDTRRANAIEIQYTVGYGDATDQEIPKGIIQGMLQWIAFAYNHRGDCIDSKCLVACGAKNILDQYKVYKIG